MSYIYFNNSQLIDFFLNIGDLFEKDLRMAFKMSAKHQAIFEEYSSAFPSDTVKKWQEIVERWEKDQSSKPDPYEEVSTCMCLNSSFTISTDKS